jgi:hypothetical protein
MGPFVRDKWPGREADPSPPSSAEVKNEWSSTSAPRYALTACAVTLRILKLRVAWHAASDLSYGTDGATGSCLKLLVPIGLLQEISGSFRLLSQNAGRTQNVPADSQGGSGAKHPVMARQSDSSVEEIISIEESDVAPTPGG